MTGVQTCALPISLPLVIAAEPLERKLLKALKAGEISGLEWEEQLRDAVTRGAVTADEAAILSAVREKVMEVIAVDAFDADEFRLGRAQEQSMPNQQAA